VSLGQKPFNEIEPNWIYPKNVITSKISTIFNTKLQEKRNRNVSLGHQPPFDSDRTQETDQTA